MMKLEHRVPPPLVFAVFALAAALCARLLPGASVAFRGQTVAAVVLLAAGIAVAAAALVQFRRSHTTTNPMTPGAASALVDQGIFAFTRNPMYLGLAFALTALVVWLGNAAGILLLAGFIAYIGRFQIAPEERALRAKFGNEFDDYARRVRRWI